MGNETKPLPPNWKHIGSSFYLVRTQAGFRQALNHWKKKMDYDDDDNMRLLGFPKAYPAIVSFSDGYRGYHYIRCNVVHVNKMQAIVKDA